MAKIIDDIASAKRLIVEADTVLVVAGAGMSVGAEVEDYGRSFVDNASFRHFYPKMTFAKTSWEASFSRNQPSGWWIHHTHMMSGGWPANQAYSTLLELIGHKDYFVLTSNVDGLFSRAGFDPARLYTPQGDFRVRQCAGPCSNSATWFSRPDVDRLLPHVDKNTMELTCEVPTSWTMCHRCGSERQRPNLRGGSFFVHTPYQSQQDRLVEWVEAALRDEKKLVVLEIGAGFNTPVVTRLPAESIAREASAPFIRINLSESTVPSDLPVIVSIAMDTTDALKRMVAATPKVCQQTSDAKYSTIRRRSPNNDWRQMLRNLQDPRRAETERPLPSWSGNGLSSLSISANGQFPE